MSDPLTQPASAFVDKNGKPLPLLRTKMGSSQSIAVTTTAGAAVAVHTADYNVAVRLWAIGCPIIYKIGPSGVSAPSVTADGYIGQDRAVETFMAPTDTHIRAAAASGSGTLRVEVLV